ncbi:efflux RND transporter periplasmic adaptor subunit [Hymenobacter ginsengisoli]|uniref:Efflux RND transporter periplasmic adaptor subunit n=1 Tax=Hymenobacter ginsengisoli TaxID=1051626 RepID=A0ABP8QUI2_9BACT|nr:MULTISPECIES: efflux RND transporter periplasmic adaptor subunit [unclassified Hymenobacter]MBO2033414.1 efflux RND transporter periplasmic adaptor subunit [Hymenobacter sp. BT559]
MKKSWNNSPWWYLLLVSLLGACQSQPQSNAPTATVTAPPAAVADRYTCPMHPQIVRDQPGACPICGMTLVKKVSANAAPAPASAGLPNLLQAPNATVVSTVATVHPSPDAADLTLTLPGRVEYDVRRTDIIAARIGGRVEKLLVRSNYQPVTKGQKLLELYSPQLVTAQEELIFILTNDAQNRTLLQGARQKLRLLGLTDAQINRTVATRQPQYQVAVYSPYTGYIVAQPAQAGPGQPAAAPAPEAGGGAMGGSTPAMGSPTPATVSATPLETGLTLTEGSYVTARQPLFRVVNTQQVWGVFEPQPDELAGLRVGQTIRVVPEDNPTRTLTARIDLVEPLFRNGASTGAVRVHLANPGGRLRSGTLLTGTVKGSASGGLWLPRTAVVDLGNQQVAFIRTGGAFHAVPVQTGQRTADRVQVLRGLNQQDAVAANGQFLVDSEGFLQPSTSAYHDN